MKLLDVSPRAAHPPDRGSTVRMSSLLQRLSQQHEVRQYSLDRIRASTLGCRSRERQISAGYREYRRCHLLAELVGEVADEGELRVAEIRSAGNRLVVEASADVDDLAEQLNVDLPTGDFHTVAGLVINVAGRIPAVDDEIEISGHVFRVTEGNDRRLRTLEVDRSQK